MKGERRLGMAGAAQSTVVGHRCGHAVRWHFFGNVEQRKALAALARCALCEGEVPQPCDIVWPGTGVAHMHEGHCPDSPHARFLDDMGARIRPFLAPV